MFSEPVMFGPLCCFATCIRATFEDAGEQPKNSVPYYLQIPIKITFAY